MFGIILVYPDLYQKNSNAFNSSAGIKSRWLQQAAKQDEHVFTMHARFPRKAVLDSAVTTRVSSHRSIIVQMFYFTRFFFILVEYFKISHLDGLMGKKNLIGLVCNFHQGINGYIPRKIEHISGSVNVDVEKLCDKLLNFLPYRNDLAAPEGYRKGCCLITSKLILEFSLPGNVQPR